MSLSCGLVGLPNVGKSTLFNAILKKAKAEAANYPFCTIEPNTGQVAVDDSRLNVLSKISETNKIVPALLDCVDIAGLVKGAYKGEGLGNKFLGHIRECDLIIQVLRCFEDSDIVHVEGDVDPARDYDIICLELQFSDIEHLDKFLNQKKNNDPKLKKIAQEAKEYLQGNYFLNSREWDEDSLLFFKQHGMLTHKPMIVVANVQQASDDIFVEQIAHLNPIKISASFELMLQELDDENERLAMLKEAGLEGAGLSMILQRAYKDLGLLSFFTTGKQETRAWTVRKGQTMQDAAGVIHTDFYKGFISAEVVKCEDFIKANGWNGAKDTGCVRTCSKTTLVEDGDICIFKTYN